MNDIELQKLIQLIKDTHPRPVQVTMKQAAEMLNMSHPTLKKMVLGGQIRLNDAGMIPITEVDKFAYPKAA